MSTFRRVILAALAVAGTASSLAAQGIGLTVNDFGIAVGNRPRVNGLRINWRDSGLDRVNGVNITMLAPQEPASGTVTGVALGLPMTGAARIHGLGLGIGGVSASRELVGLGVGGIGVGTGGDARGIMIGGIGAGAGGNITGAALGLIGVGSGGSISGFTFGGVGVGSGADIRGIAIGGIGVGGGADVRGIAIGGVGVGAGADATGILGGIIGVGVGGDMNGIAIGGVGVGAGRDFTGVALGGVGVGVGGTLKGIAAGIAGVGAQRIEGGVAGLVVRARDVQGLVIAPAWFKTEQGGTMHGLNVSAFNQVRGTQTGLAIGLVNYARELHGFQVGIINILDRASGRRVMPLVNYSR